MTATLKIYCQRRVPEAVWTPLRMERRATCWRPTPVTPPRSCTVISTYIDCTVRTCYVESSRGNSKSVFARCLCLVPVVSVRSSVSRFSPRPVTLSHVARDALFLRLQFFFRRVLFLYLAFPAMLGPCISRFSCSGLVSRVSLFPVMVITLYPHSACSQPINFAIPPAMVCVMFHFKLGVGVVASSWGKAARPAEAKWINISNVPWPRAAGRSHFARIRSAYERLGTQHTKRIMNKCNVIVISCVHCVYYHVQWN